MIWNNPVFIHVFFHVFVRIRGVLRAPKPILYRRPGSIARSFVGNAILGLFRIFSDGAQSLFYAEKITTTKLQPGLEELVLPYAIDLFVYFIDPELLRSETHSLYRFVMGASEHHHPWVIFLLESIALDDYVSYYLA